MTDYYTPSGAPTAQGRGVSSSIRAEFVLIQTAFGTVLSDMAGKGALTGATWTGTHDFSGATLVKLSASTLYGAMNAGGYVISNAGNAVAAGDLVNLQTAQALFSGGGTPANIPITSLGKGTATANQLIRVNAAGTALEGVPGWINAFSTLTGAATLAAWQPYRFNTSGVTYSLPISPADGDECLLVNAGTNINNVLSGNGRNIVGPYNSAASVNMNVPYGTFHVKYDLTSTVWRTV